MMKFPFRRDTSKPETTSGLDLMAWWNDPTHSLRTTNAEPREWLRYAKFALPAIGVVLLIIAFVWPTILPSFPTVGTALSEIKGEIIKEAAMFDLSYQGISKSGTPYGVTAEKATRDATGTNEQDPAIVLAEPKADFTSREGSFIALTATQGVYREKTQGLELQGDVEIFHDNGTTFTAPQLTVDFNANSATTTSPVTVHGPFGQIDSSQGMQVLDGGDKVIFTGPAKAHLTGASPSDAVESPPPPAAVEGQPDIVGGQ